MQQWPPNVWHGVIDPNGEPISPTIYGSANIEETYDKVKHVEEMEEQMREMLETEP